jgi:hypothetical protein
MAHVAFFRFIFLISIVYAPTGVPDFIHSFIHF